jgi:hypothetical protein
MKELDVHYDTLTSFRMIVDKDPVIIKEFAEKPCTQKMV